MAHVLLHLECAHIISKFSLSRFLAASTSRFAHDFDTSSADQQECRRLIKHQQLRHRQPCRQPRRQQQPIRPLSRPLLLHRLHRLRRLLVRLRRLLLLHRLARLTSRTMPQCHPRCPPVMRRVARQALSASQPQGRLPIGMRQKRLASSTTLATS